MQLHSQRICGQWELSLMFCEFIVAINYLVYLLKRFPFFFLVNSQGVWFVSFCGWMWCWNVNIIYILYRRCILYYYLLFYSMGNVTVGKYDFNDEAFDKVSTDCIDFITKLLMKDHSERLTAQEALRHKWVKRKPQYYPNSQKSITSSLSTSLKSPFPDKVRRNFDH